MLGGYRWLFLQPISEKFIGKKNWTNFDLVEIYTNKECTTPKHFLNDNLSFGFVKVLLKASNNVLFVVLTSPELPSKPLECNLFLFFRSDYHY
jgi:hypothetical protein